MADCIQRQLVTLRDSQAVLREAQAQTRADFAHLGALIDVCALRMLKRPDKNDRAVVAYLEERRTS